MRLAAVFKDNMVLQRDKQIRIFGDCKDGDEIVVTLAGITVKTESKGNRFLAVFPPLEKQTGVDFMSQTDLKR